MFIKKKGIFIVLFIGLFCLSSCMLQNQVNKLNEDFNIDYNTSVDDDKKYEKQMGYLLGTRIKEIYASSESDIPVIYVNESIITKREVESEKIVSELFSYSLKDRIYKLIQEKIALEEANKLGIKPSQDRIDDYIHETKESLKTEVASAIYAYMEGRSITEEEYLNEIIEEQYKNYQREAWWESVKPEKKIQMEAKERNIDIGIVDYEYYKKFVDELIMKSDIQIFDPEIEELFLEEDFMVGKKHE